MRACRSPLKCGGGMSMPQTTATRLDLMKANGFRPSHFLTKAERSDRLKICLVQTDCS